MLKSDAVTQAQSASTNGDVVSTVNVEADTGLDYIGY
jgi:hypothetical protein